MRKAMIKGHKVLFTDIRGDVPLAFEYPFRYDIRHDDMAWEPCTIEKDVVVNWFGSIFSKNEIFPELNAQGHINIGEEDFYFTGD